MRMLICYMLLLFHGGMGRLNMRNLSGITNYSKQYVFHGMRIECDEDASEGFGYGYRNGNELRQLQNLVPTQLLYNGSSGNQYPTRGNLCRDQRLRERKEKFFLI